MAHNKNSMVFRFLFILPSNTCLKVSFPESHPLISMDTSEKPETGMGQNGLHIRRSYRRSVCFLLRKSILPCTDLFFKLYFGFAIFYFVQSIRFGLGRGSPFEPRPRNKRFLAFKGVQHAVGFIRSEAAASAEHTTSLLFGFLLLCGIIIP